MNGVYENAVLTALKSHSNLSEIVLCVDNDEGGIEAVDRLRDILNENGYSNVKRLAPPYKDWNEVLKAKNGAPALPAVPNKHKEEYHLHSKISPLKFVWLSPLLPQHLLLHHFQLQGEHCPLLPCRQQLRSLCPCKRGQGS